MNEPVIVDEVAPGGAGDEKVEEIIQVRVVSMPQLIGTTTIE